MKLSRIVALTLSITSMANSSSLYKRKYTKHKKLKVKIKVVSLSSHKNESSVLTLEISKTVNKALISLRTLTANLLVAGLVLQRMTKANPSTTWNTLE